MRKRMTLLLLFAVLAWSGKVCAQHEFHDSDSLGNLWVVTVDLSGSMIDGGHFPGKTVQAKAQYMANRLAPHLIEGKSFDPVDFSRDAFIFFTSGYRYPYLHKGEPSFDSCFIHHTDGKIHHFNSRKELADHICNLLNYSKYRYVYQQSFVSQIAPFSAVKASRYISQQHWGDCYGAMYVVTLTDDAEGTLQWMNDFKNIKKWDAKKAEEISEITSQYIYNSLTGKGKGRMTELSVNEDFYVHVRSYRYELRDASAQHLRDEEALPLTARDGSTVKLEIPAAYSGDSVQFIQIDSIRANDRMFYVGQRFVPNNGETQIPIEYDVKRFRNNFAIYGYMQVEYGDTLWGDHLKKVYFEQASSQMPDRVIWHIVLCATGAALLLAAVLWLLLAFIPNINLLTISIGCYDFYVLRCRRRFWKKEGTHLLSCLLKEDGTYTPLLSSRLPMLRAKSDSKGNSDTITLRSRHQLSLSLQDKPYDIHYSEENGEHIYTLKNVLAGVISLTLPLVGRPLLISIEEEKEREYHKISHRLELSVLQKYLTKRHKKRTVQPRYDAIVTYGQYGGYIYWSVLVPEYDSGTGLTLSQARCLFSFRHPKEGVENQLLKLRDLLVKQVRKEHPEFKKVVAARVTFNDELKSSNCNFTIFYPACGSYLCAVETSLSKPSMQTLYSPMGDEWEKSCIPVLVRHMQNNAELVSSFLPYPVLRDAFDTIPDCLRYGIGGDSDNPLTSTILTFHEDRDFLSIVFTNVKVDKNSERYRISTPATKLSFDRIINEPFCY